MTQAAIANEGTAARALKACRIDFITLSVSREHLDSADAWCVEKFGMPRAGKGGLFLKASRHYAGGRCSLYFDPPSESMKEHVVLSVTGSGCKQLGDDDIVDSFRDFIDKCGAKITRMDIAVDHTDSSFPVTIEGIEQACDTGQLCRARTHDVNRKRSGQRVTGETIYLGKRGKKGSGRCVCVYDKGLESGTTNEQGEWIRWESRFYDDCAQQAFEIYGFSDIQERILLAYDAVEFRENTGDQHIERRPLVSWYRKLRGSIKSGIFVRRLRRDSSPARLVRWKSIAVVPILAYVKKMTGITWDDLMSTLVDKNAPEYKPKEHVLQLVEEMTKGYVDDDGVEHESVYSMLFNRTIFEHEAA